MLQHSRAAAPHATVPLCPGESILWLPPPWQCVPPARHRDIMRPWTVPALAAGTVLGVTAVLSALAPPSGAAVPAPALQAHAASCCSPLVTASMNPVMTETAWRASGSSSVKTWNTCIWRSQI